MSNRSIYAFGSLLVLIIIGMLLGSFRLIIYPYAFVLGLLLISGIGKSLKSNKKILWFPIIITVLFLLLLIGLDRVTLDSPIGDGGLIFGFTLSTAIYYIGIWALCASVSLIYTWSFKQQSVKQSAVNTKSIDL